MRVLLLAEALLEPEVLLSQPPKYWDYRCVPPHPAHVTINILVSIRAMNQFGFIGRIYRRNFPLSVGIR